MNLKRLWYSLRLYTMLNSKKRGDYVRKHKLFNECGEVVRLPQMLLPLHSEMISIGNNVEIASDVMFVVHDAIHSVLNEAFKTQRFEENKVPITIGDNVFIGARSVILGGVNIGSNVVIGACSLVNKDIPSNTVYAGVPAKKIGSFSELANKRESVRDGV